MLNINQHLLHISKNFQKDEFDIARNGFKKIIFDVSTIDLRDDEYVFNKNRFIVKTLGSKRVRLAMFLEEIQQRIKESQILKDFTLVL